MTQSVDFGVIIALQEELEAFLEVFAKEGELTIEDDLYHLVRLEADDGSMRRGAVRCFEDQTSAVAVSATERLIQHFSPTIVVSFGISGRLDSQLYLCDVVISTEVHDLSFRTRASGIKSSTPTEHVSRNITIDPGGKAINTEPSLCAAALQAARKPQSRQFLRNSLDELRRSISEPLYQTLQEQSLIQSEVQVYSGPTACGNTVIAAEEARKLFLERNRLYRAVDMESFGVLTGAGTVSLNKRPRTLVVRGISDPSNEQKTQIDKQSGGKIRRTAARHAAYVLLTTLAGDNIVEHTSRPASIAELQSRLEKAIRSTSLSTCYQKSLDWTDSDLERSELLWSRIVHSDSSCKGITAVLETVSADPGSPIVRITGEPGCGKSAFLSAIYLEQLRRFSAGTSPILPIFVDLHRYRRFDAFNEVQEGADPVGQSHHHLARHLEILDEILKSDPKQRLLVLLDGLDEAALPLKQLLKRIKPYLRKPHCLIVGLRPNHRDLVTFLGLTRPTIEIKLVEIPADPESLNLAIRAFHGQSDAGNRINEAIDALMKFGSESYDLLTVAQTVDYAMAFAPASVYISSVYENYALSRLAGGADVTELVSPSLEALCDLAYARWTKRPDVERRKRLEMGDSRAQVEFEFLFAHPGIRDWMVSRSILWGYQDVETRDGLVNDISGLVLPYRFNRYIKDMMREGINWPIEENILACLDALVSKKEWERLPHVCYLAGRLQRPQAIKEAMRLLNEARGPLTKIVRDLEHGSDDRRYRLLALLRRNVLISLIYLGDKGAKLEYILELLRSRVEDDLNRGFHLEYYGDMPFDPTTLPASNDFGRPFPRVLLQLERRLRSSNSNPLEEIELHTICSLVRYRLEQGTLDERTRQKVMSLIKDVLHRAKTRGGLEPGELATYAELVVQHAADRWFTPLSIGLEFLQIKRPLRVSAGVDPDIVRAESAADHTMGACMIAKLFLPEEPEEFDSHSGYDKEKIVAMLLVHNWAEAIVARGGEEARSQDMDEERSVFEKLRLCGAYHSIFGVDEIYKLWEEFAAVQTLNSQVANEIDKLENLIQLYRYRELNVKVDGFDQRVNLLLGAIRTHYGERVKHVITSHYLRPVSMR